ncbi:hypothetical protein [Desulfococcus sp.]|uniref:hypothetical protein n=1 Tax=Desulfococcus sp. TaxID=2025834 RepID=UPI0035931B85
MNYLIYLLFFVVYVSNYLFQTAGIAFKGFAILPETISLVVGIYILLYFALYRKIKLRPSYFYFYVAFAVHVLIGVIGNQVQPLAVLNGLRVYFKFVPFYFLPLIYDIEEESLKRHITMMLAIALLQCPLAVYQRMVEYAHTFSGDRVAGTLTAAPVLTLFLVCTISVLIGFYIKKRISLKTFAILVFVSFLPTAINETKATVILLPLAVLIPSIFGVKKGARIKVVATVIPAMILMVVGFHFLYKIIYERNYDVVEFYTKGKVTEYLYKGKEAEQVVGGIESEVGRLDSILYAYTENSEDLFRLIWGVGIGNAAVSFSKKFQGKYTDEYIRLGGQKTGLSVAIWEIGLFGIFHIVWFLFLVFFDAMKLRDQKDLPGSIALGWLGVIAVFAAAMPYQNLITKNELMYPFFYISGLIAAKRYSVEKTMPETSEPWGIGVPVSRTNEPQRG